MKVVCMMLFLLAAIAAEAQVPFTKPDYCKKKEIQLTTGKTFPQNQIIVGTGNFLKDEAITSLETIPVKVVRKMRKLAHHFHACTIFVDFSNSVPSPQDKSGNDLSATHVQFYIIQPLFYLVAQP